MAVAILVTGCREPEPSPSAHSVVDPVGAVLAQSRTHELASPAIDQIYRIDVALPLDYESSEGIYSVLYVLDGDLMFGLASDISRLLPLEAIPPFLGEARVPGLIVVGIGYPGGVAEMTEKRDRDFSPPRGESGEVNPEGAADFHRFLSEVLFPFVEANYRADPADRSLLGVSRGGVFVLQSLFLHPEAFHRYLALSPTVEPPIFEYAEQLAAETLSGRLYVSSGTAGAIETDIRSQVERLSAALEERDDPDLRWSTGLFEAESHASVVPRALVEGLVAVFSEE